MQNILYSLKNNLFLSCILPHPILYTIKSILYPLCFFILLANTMFNTFSRASFIHVAIPGQEPGAADLPKDFVFPKIKVTLD